MAKKSRPATATNRISKMEAVRRAMAELGIDATRTAIQKFVKDRFSTDMSVDVISTYKADITRRTTKAKRAAPADPSRALKTTSAPKTDPNPGGIGLADIEAVKALVRRLGASNLKKLIDVLAG
jgi:hypothetical protein